MDQKFRLPPDIKKFATVEYVKCPLCTDEWSKLHPCDFQPQGREAVTSFVCVECAEGVKALPAVNKLNPIYGVKIYVDPIPFFKKAEELDMRSAWQAKVVLPGDDTYVVRCRPTSYPIYIVKNTAIHSFQNIYQAWEFLKNPVVEEQEKESFKFKSLAAFLVSLLIIR